MNDLDKLRSALREEPDQPFAAPDLGRIITEGRRIRRRRRIATGAGAAAAVAAVVGIVFGAVALRTPAEPTQVPVAAPPAPATSGPVASDGALPTTSPPPTSAIDQVPNSATQPYGDVIHTGIKTAAGGELVFYATKIDDNAALPDVHFGIMAAVQTKTGYLSLYASNEIRGADRSFGFHATAGGMAAGGTWVPVYGYFSGPAVKIVSTVHGKPVVAQTAVWSVDPRVVVFWFDQREVPDPAVLTPLVAYGKDGTRLTK